MATAAVARCRGGLIRGAPGDGFTVFRGIPFAAAPRAERRFAPPAPPQPWCGIRDALAHPPAAPQNPGDVLSRMFPDNAPGYGEDCLTLTLWTPGLDDARRPVLVWIHGGRFLHGSASELAYDGSSLARRGDVVVVAIQYRLGPLGYLDFDDTADWQSNLGVLDQIAALRWVRDEIAAFGGDAGNVTLMGQSAGSISAGVLLATPAAEGLFHRAILQSGPPVALPRAAARPVGETLLRHLGLAQARQLAAASVEALLACEDACAAAPGDRPLGLPYLPVIDGDVVPADPLERLAAGRGADVPLIIGTTRDEMSAFLFLDPETRTLDEEGLRHRVAALLADEDTAAAAIEVYRRARIERGEPATPVDIWFALLADRHVRQPAMCLAGLGGGRRSRSWVYRFDWHSPFLEGALGACHGIDVPFVFGTVAEGPLAALTGATAAAMRLAALVQDTWIRFARTGAPGTDWPAYDRDTRATMLFGATPGVESAPAEPERAFWDEAQPRPAKLAQRR